MVAHMLADYVPGAYALKGACIGPAAIGERQVRGIHTRLA